jgi:hypothetical protein
MDEINENVISFVSKDVYTLKLLYMAMVSINMNIYFIFLLENNINHILRYYLTV